MSARALRLRSASRRSGDAIAPWQRPRRGAIIVLVGILIVTMVALAALAIDFGRLDNLKADLQTSAEAAALAGAVELIPGGGHNYLVADDSARAYALLNPAMQATVTVVSTRCGFHSDILELFPLSCAIPLVNNAVEVTVSRQSSGLFMSVLGVTPPIVRATARAAVRPDLVLPLACGGNCRVYLLPVR